MRSVKSLISGFGVAISLVGAVACAFFITAALVAFNGSFEVSDNPGPQSSVLTASVKRERPILIAAAARPAVSVTVPRAVVAPAASAAITSTVTPIVSRQTSTATTAPTAPKEPAPTPAQAPPSKPSTTAPLANATAGLAQAVGTVVTNATGSLAATVAPISPALGGTLHALGTGLTNVVVSLGATVAGVVNALGTHPAAPQG